MARLLGKTLTWGPVHRLESQGGHGRLMRWAPREELTGVSRGGGGAVGEARLGLILSRPALGRPESPHCQPGLPPSQLELEASC